MRKVIVVSVTDKGRIVEDVSNIKEVVESQGDTLTIYSTGGTARKLREGGLEVHDLQELTGGEELFGDLVKSLSREVAAGLLARPEHRDELEARGMTWIDYLIVDFYELEKAIQESGGDRAAVIKATDIGGPTMVREAAKGRRVVICQPEDRQRVIEWLRANRPGEDDFLTELEATAEWVVGKYATTSAIYHGNGKYAAMFGEKVCDCKAENGHQGTAALFSVGTDDPLALSKFRLVAGADPSYNNWCDVDRMTQTVSHIAAAWKLNFGHLPFIAEAAKHGNACGCATGGDEAQTLRKMIDGDTRAIFGGLVMTTFKITEDLAEVLLTYQMPTGKRRLLDGIVAPSFDESAIETLRRKGDKCRFIENPKLANPKLDKAQRFRYVRGGFLCQANYEFVLNLKDPHLAIYDDMHVGMSDDVLLAWAICATSNSNTITLVKNGMLIGNGVAQQDRVGAAQLAIHRARSAGHTDISGATACSDSFFPFTDAVEELLAVGVKRILSTSGSVNDPETIRVCQKAGVALYLFPDPEARSFFGH